MQHVTKSPAARQPQRWLFSLILLVTCLMPIGCSQIVTLGYLIGGPPSIEPDFDKVTGISLNKKGKKVLILCDAPKEVKWDFDSIDRELSRYVAHRLSANKIKVMDPDAVNEWLDLHADWDTPDEIGRYFEADYVIFLEVNEFGLYEQGSMSLYRGHAECMITVYKMEDGEGENIYSKEYVSKFPLLEPVSTSDQSYYDFKRLYMSRLSDEIGRHFYEHFAGDDIPHGSL